MTVFWKYEFSCPWLTHGNKLSQVNENGKNECNNPVGFSKKILSILFTSWHSVAGEYHLVMLS